MKAKTSVLLSCNNPFMISDHQKNAQHLLKLPHFPKSNCWRSNESKNICTALLQIPFMISASDNKLTTPSALSHEAMLPLSRLIKFDGIVRHGFLLSSIFVFKTSRWRERFFFYTSFCVDGYFDRHMAVIPVKGLNQ